MSGDRYGHLHTGIYDLGELVTRRHHLKAMAERLAELPWAREAAIETERILAKIERLEIQVQVRGDALSDVWYAIEKWDSGDWLEDSARRALAEYRGDPPPAPAQPGKEGE